MRDLIACYRLVRRTIGCPELTRHWFYSENALFGLTMPISSFKQGKGHLVLEPIKTLLGSSITK